MSAVVSAPRWHAVSSVAPGPRPQPAPAPAPAVAAVPVPAPAAAPLPPVVQLARRLDAARAAGFSPRCCDDLLVLQGMGARIALLLRAAGFGSYAALAAAKPRQLRALVDLDDSPWPDTWPGQAALAAAGQWDTLRQLQDKLTACA